MPSYQRKKKDSRGSASAASIQRPPSTEQLAQIQALHIEIKRLRRLSFRPLSFVTSIVLSYLLFKTLFTEEWAIFHSSYQRLLEGYTAHAREKAQEILDSGVDYLHQNDLDWMHERMKALSQIREFSRRYGNIDNPMEIMQTLEDFAQHEPVMRPEIEGYKKLLSDAHNHILAQLPSGAGQEYRINPEKIDDYSVAELYQLLEKLALTVRTKLPEIIANVYSGISLGLLEKLVSIPLTIFAQHFGIDPLLTHIKQSDLNVKSLLTTDDAVLTIAELQSRKKVLEHTSKRNIKISRYLGIPSFLSAIYMLFIARILSPEMIVFAITCFATALNDFQKDAQEYLAARLFDTKLAEQNNLIKQTIGAFNLDVQNNRGSTLESSYFILSFKQTIINHQIISAKKIAAMFKEACLHYGVSIISQNGTRVTLLANPGLNASKAARIQTHFKTSIKREANIRQLKNQVSGLMKAVGRNTDNLLFRPESDEENLPILFVELTLPRTTNLMVQLQILFANYDYHVSESDDSYKVTFLAHAPIPDQVFQDATRKIRPELEPTPAGVMFDDGSARALTNAVRAEPKLKLGKKAEADAENSAETSSSRVIRWRSKIYDSAKSDNVVHPILGQRHDRSALAKTRFFVSDGIDWEQFKKPEQRNRTNDDALPATIKALKAKITAQVTVPQFIPSRGKQGIKLWNRQERDQYGAWFQTQAKIKLKGKFGAARAYAEAEQSETGETLLVVKGFSLTHS